MGRWRRFGWWPTAAERPRGWPTSSTKQRWAQRGMERGGRRGKGEQRERGGWGRKRGRESRKRRGSEEREKGEVNSSIGLFNCFAVNVVATKILLVNWLTSVFLSLATIFVRCTCVQPFLFFIYFRKLNWIIYLDFYHLLQPILLAVILSQHNSQQFPAIFIFNFGKNFGQFYMYSAYFILVWYINHPWNIDLSIKKN